MKLVTSTRRRPRPPFVHAACLGCAWWAFAVALPAAAVAQAISREALAKVPVRLELNRSIWREQAGDPVELQVGLRNAFDEPVAAPADVPVQVRSTALPDAIQVVIGAGTTSRSLSFRAPSPGTATIEVVGERLSSATCVLVTSPRAPAEVAVDAKPGASPAPSVTAKPPPAGALEPRVLINPEQVRPDAQGQWTATVKLALFDEANRLVRVGSDFPVQFTAQLGSLSRDVVDFKAGEYLTPAVALVSRADGVDVVSASTPLGSSKPVEVAYQLPFPARLRVEASPPRITNTGSAAPVQILVVLVSEIGVVTSYPDRDVVVSLRSTLGQLDHATLTIPRSSHGTMAALTSVRDGRAVVAASAAGLASGETTVRFSFPLLLAVLASLGGVAGAFVARPRQFSTRAHVVRSVVTGLLVGFVFFAVASFHAFRTSYELPLPVDATKIVTGNELGALVLGCIGGFLGRALWRTGGKGSGAKKSGGAPGT